LSFLKRKKAAAARNGGGFMGYSIKRECLQMILEASKEHYPMEFAALLSAKNKVIDELVLIPGTVAGDAHAIFHMWNAPVDFSIVGTVHSHPSHSARPSDADLAFFSDNGPVHIITAMPFDTDSWRAYDAGGNRITLQLVDRGLPNSVQF